MRTYEVRKSYERFEGTSKVTYNEGKRTKYVGLVLEERRNLKKYELQMVGYEGEMAE